MLVQLPIVNAYFSRPTFIANVLVFYEILHKRGEMFNSYSIYALQTD